MKNYIVLLLAAFLIGCTGPAYEADFKGIDLGCCIVKDTFHPSKTAMLEGKSNLFGETSYLSEVDGTLQMATSPPLGTASGVASTEGIYSTGLSLGPGKGILISATFQSPTREATQDPWSVLLIMRPGDSADDNPNAARLQLSLRTVLIGAADIQARSVELRVQEGTTAEKTKKFSDPNSFKELSGTAALSDIDASKPFKLTLYVNRRDGTGIASLATDSQTVTLTFNPAIFAQNTGDPPINVVGAAIANTAVWRLAAVKVSHFEIKTGDPW